MTKQQKGSAAEEAQVTQNLFIRDWPCGLHRELRVIALLEGENMKGIIEQACRQWLDRYRAEQARQK